jgi:hypothetical protein
VIGLGLVRDEPQAEDVQEVLGDSAYGTADMRVGLADPHDPLTAVIKPPPVRPSVPDGFSTDDFDVDEVNRQVTCPAGHTRPITAKRTVTFGSLPRLPAARTVHHQQGRADPEAAPPRRRTAWRPPRLGRQP